MLVVMYDVNMGGSWVKGVWELCMIFAILL